MYRFLAPILAASWLGMRSFAPCCTQRSHPPLHLPQADAAERGREVLVAGLPCYEARPSSENSDSTNGPVVLVFTDVFGWRSGRTRLLCDQLAEEAGLQVQGRAFSCFDLPETPRDDVPWQVLLPNFFHNDGSDHAKPLEGWRAGWYVAKRILYFDWSEIRPARIVSWQWLMYPLFRTPTTYVEPALRDKLLPYLLEKGPRRIGMLGFCWGGWMALHAAKYPAVSAAIAMHPSMKMEAFHGGTARGVYEAIHAPSMCLAAGDDPQEVKPGGELAQVLAAHSVQAQVEEFPDMDHGWVPRGKAEDPKIAEAVTSAMQKAVEFLRCHLGSACRPRL